MRALALVGLLVAGTASAQQYRPFRMQSTADRPFPVYVDSRSTAIRQPNGQTISLSAARQATEDAWATWNAVAAAAPKVRVVGLSGSNPNVIVGSRYDVYSVFPDFVSSTTQSEWNEIFGATTYVTAITYEGVDQGVLRTCDTYLDMVGNQYSVDNTLPAGAVDLRTVLLHEAGHCLGLDHFGSQLMGDIMPFNILAGQRRWELGPTDIQSLVVCNPSEGAVGSPCGAGSGAGDGGCGAGSGLRCVQQPLFGVDAGTGRYCARGCDATTASACEFPTTCQVNAGFPGFSDACLWPATTVTQVGAACEPGSACGSNVGWCLGPLPSPAEPMTWLGGYCTQTCGRAGDPLCPSGSKCINAGTTAICLQECRPGLADCRADYACDPTSLYTCVPKCRVDEDCGDAGKFQCRTCDGLCVAKQNVAGQVGDPCTSNETCGPGQECVQMDLTSGRKVCAEQCGRNCGTCNGGQRCVASARGGLYCALACNGPFTCGAGTRCGIVGGARVCIPACVDSVECLAGEECNSGECVPIGSGGFGGGEPTVDGGRPVVIVPRDGGAGGSGGDGGCGCDSGSDTSGSSFGVGLLFAAVAVAFNRRKRSV